MRGNIAIIVVLVTAILVSGRNTSLEYSLGKTKSGLSGKAPFFSVLRKQQCNVGHHSEL